MSIISRPNPVNLRITKDMFVSAIRFATCIEGPPFGDELRTSQEQVEYMLGEDEDTAIIMADNEVRLAITMGVSKIFCLFEMDLSYLLLDPDLESEAAHKTLLQRVADLEWMCNVLPKMDLMKNFVSNWTAIFSKIVGMIEDKKLDRVMWGLKAKLIEVSGKVLEAVVYGSVMLPALCRVQLLNTWLPYVRKMRPMLDSKAIEMIGFPY